MTSPGNPPQLPGAPCADDPTGLTFDRADLAEPTTTRTAGDGWAVTGRGTTTTTAADEPHPGCTVHGLPPFNLRGLARAHITAADWARIEQSMSPDTRDVVEDVYRVIEQSRRARGADTGLREVA